MLVCASFWNGKLILNFANGTRSQQHLLIAQRLGNIIQRISVIIITAEKIFISVDVTHVDGGLRGLFIKAKIASSIQF